MSTLIITVHLFITRNLYLARPISSLHRMRFSQCAVGSSTITGPERWGSPSVCSVLCEWHKLVITLLLGGGPRVVVSTAAFHARVRGSVPGLGGLKETKLFLPHPRVKVSIVGSLRDQEVACSASDRQGSNFESCVWRTVLSQSSHHPQEVLLAQFSLYVHKGGLKPDSFHLLRCYYCYYVVKFASLVNIRESLSS